MAYRTAKGMAQSPRADQVGALKGGLAGFGIADEAAGIGATGCAVDGARIRNSTTPAAATAKIAPIKIAVGDMKRLR